MQRKLRIVWVVLCLVGLAVVFLGRPAKPPPSAEIIARFAAEKEKQARELNRHEARRWPREASQFFTAAKAGDWPRASATYRDLSQKYGSSPASVSTNIWDRFMMQAYGLGSHFGLLPTNYWPNLRTSAWQPIEEVNSAIHLSDSWDPGLVQLFATNILQCVPQHSIYFGASDAGRFLITALSKSQINGDPFFVLTQNGLVDNDYLEYASQMYGSKIHLPNQQGIQKAFSDYITEAKARQSTGTLKPGENVTVSGANVSVGGIGAVMEMNGKLLRQIFDANPDREFYIELNTPIEWLNPYLTPHGLILKLNHVAPATLDQNMVDSDRAFWTELVGKLVGLKIDYDTSLQQIADAEEPFFLKGDLSGFKGNSGYPGNRVAQNTFARLRIATAGVYVWRSQNSGGETERLHMAREADLAFRQGFALCPSADALSAYEDQLQAEHRTNDLRVLRQLRSKYFAPLISVSDGLK